MKCRAIVFECSYIMNFMVFQAHFNIYYGIMRSTAWCRVCFIADNFVFILDFLRSKEFTPY